MTTAQKTPCPGSGSDPGQHPYGIQTMNPDVSVACPVCGWVSPFATSCVPLHYPGGPAV